MNKFELKQKTLKRIPLLWRRILDLQLDKSCSNQVIARVIAQAIAEAIRNNSLPLGSALPTTREIAEHLMPTVNKATVDVAWSILKNELKLIVTQYGHGTHVVSTFREITNDPASSADLVTHSRSAHFNSEFILPTDRTIKGLITAMHKEIIKYPVPNDYKIGNKIAPHLVNALLKVVNNSLCSTYKYDELYYAQDLQQLIHHICNVAMSSRKIFVMTDTVSLLVRAAVMGAGYKIKIVKTDSSGILMGSLEEIVSWRNVGIVCVCSRTVMPGRHILSPERMDRLLELQKEFKFHIIDYDQYAGFFEDNLHILMDKARHRKANVIYIRPVSRMHQDFADVHIVVARAKLIGLLTEKFQNVGKIMDSRLSHMLGELFRKKMFPKYESRIRSKMGATIIKARKLLVDSGLWKREGLSCENGWFFYLELSHGQLPADIISMLKKEHIYMMDTSDFDSNYVQKIIVLSTAAYLDGDHLEDDINRLNETINRVINIRKNESTI